MSDFKQNICQICNRVFCCKKCREKHQTSKHEIFPDCDICLYGKAVISNPSEELIKHLIVSHGPLMCLFCKRLIACTVDFLQYKKCPIGIQNTEQSQKSPHTPFQSHIENNYESPPFSVLLPKSQQGTDKGNMFCNLATSTPMQRSDECNLLKNMQENLTPVDFCDINKDSIIKKSKSNKTDSLKRRVTFCETPISDSYRKQKAMLKKREEDSTHHTPDSGTSPAIFYSLKEDDALEVVAEDLKEPSEPKEMPIITTNEVGTIEEAKIEMPRNIENKEDTTMWISASNMTPLDVDRAKIPADVEATTPMAAKLRVRQVNIVMPTPVLIKDEYSITFDISNQASAIVEHNTEDVHDISEENTSLHSTNKLEDNSEIENRESFTSSFDISEDVILESRCNTANGVWSSMSRLVRNVTSVLPGFSGVETNIFCNFKASTKRSSLEYDAYDGPRIKRYKLTDIKCRRTIRELPALEINRDIHGSYLNSSSQRNKKEFVDKATQTDEYFPVLQTSD